MDFETLIAKIAKILDNLKIPYAVTGGYAVSIWGRLRATFDIDVIIEIPKSKAKPLTLALKKISKLVFVDEDMITKAIEQCDEFQFIHIESGIKIDFWVLGNDLFSRSRLERRIPRIIQGQKVFFLSPEDLILSKLLWYKESQSELQLGDIESILRIQKKLDWNYLKKWSRIHSTDKILQELWEKNKK